MIRFNCIYFASSTQVYKGSDVLRGAMVPHRIVKLSDKLEEIGCNQCLFISSEYRARALSALNEAGSRYLSVKEVDKL